MSRATITTTINVYNPAVSSVLATAAASLSAGQSLKLGSVPSAALYFSGDGSNMIQWGGSGWYDPGRKEVGFIGKRDGGTYAYHWLVYDEATEAWSNTRAVWSTLGSSGHGYDHNAFDPATGTVYHRPYNSKIVQKWTGSWSALPAWVPSINVAGGLAWWPGKGLLYSDGLRTLLYNGTAWSTIQDVGASGNHAIAEYNSTADVMIVGSGNSAPLQRINSSLVVSAAATPPFNVGVGSSQGLFISDPNSASMIALQRATANWAAYNATTDSWSTLTQSSGSGATPQTGTPNLTTETSVIGIPIPEYGVIMYIQIVSLTVAGSAWLYKHS